MTEIESKVPSVEKKKRCQHGLGCKYIVKENKHGKLCEFDHTPRHTQCKHGLKCKYIETESSNGTKCPLQHVENPEVPEHAKGPAKKTFSRAVKGSAKPTKSAKVDSIVAMIKALDLNDSEWSSLTNTIKQLGE